MEDIREIQLGTEVYDLYDDEALHAFKSATNATSIYVDAVNGNDANDGTTAATAIKTTARCLELLNSGISYPYIFLIGSNRYEFICNTFNFSGLHINSLNGNPTLVFRGDTGNPRFYGGHVNIARGTGSDYITIDALTPGGSHSLYCEGTALSIGSAHVLCSIGVVGGSANIHGCDFTDRSNAVSTRINGRCTNMRVYNCKFYVEAGGAGIALDRGSVLSMFYTDSVENLVFGGAGDCISAHTSIVLVSGAIKTDNYTGRYFNFDHCIVNLANNSAWRSVPYRNADSLVSLGSNQAWGMSYNTDASYDIDYRYYDVHITSGGVTKVYVPFGRRLNSAVTSVTASADGTAVVTCDGSTLCNNNVNSVFDISVNRYDAYGMTLDLTPKSAYTTAFSNKANYTASLHGVKFSITTI